MVVRVQERENRGKPTYTHSPFSMEHNEFKITCSKEGKLTLERKTTEGGEEINDVIEDIPALLFIRVTKMIEATRNVKFEK